MSTKPGSGTGRQFIKPRETAALIVLLWAFSCSDALAYIDPGTGSYALQIVLAVVLGGMFFIKTFFATICRNLIIEFVPKTDSQVQRLLVTREDIFDGYDQKNFEATFGKWFTIEEAVPIRASERTIYRMTTCGDRT